MSKIKSTNDYNRFKIFDGNRKLNHAHIKAMEATLSEKPHLIPLNPILVNDKFEIIDGQHRFEAIKKLGLEIHYIVGDNLGLEDIQALNAASKNWTPTDFAKSYRDLGDKNYDIYLEFKRIYKFNHDILLNYLSLDKPMTTTVFKRGLFRVTNKDKSVDLADKLSSLENFYLGYKRRSFALAFQRMWENPEYDHKQMLEKMEKYGHKLQDYALPNDYIRALEEIYNFRSRFSVRFF